MLEGWLAKISDKASIVVSRFLNKRSVRIYVSLLLLHGQPLYPVNRAPPLPPMATALTLALHLNSIAKIKK